MSGPYGSRREVAAAAEVTAAYDGAEGGPTGAAERMLTGALTVGAVELGAYDREILGWLAGCGPQVAAVIAGWVRRAAGHQVTGLGPDGSAAVAARDVPVVVAALARAMTDAVHLRDDQAMCRYGDVARALGADPLRGPIPAYRGRDIPAERETTP